MNVPEIILQKLAIMCDTLRRYYKRDTFANKLMLKKEFFRMTMNQGISIEAHIKNMNKLTDKLATLGLPISEEDQVVTLLGSLPQEFSTLVTALETRDNISLRYAHQSLIHEERKLLSNADSANSIGHEGTPCQVLTGQQRDQRHAKACSCCGKIGHFHRECPVKTIRWRPKHQPNQSTQKAHLE
jgi:hypothetical protein